MQAVLDKLTNYKYVILTEHLPKGVFTPNKDIISGQGIRLKKQSGLDILKAPFHFNTLDKEEILSIDLGGKKGVVVTSKFRVF